MDKFLVIDLDMDLRSARADFEKKYLIAQINNFNGNICIGDIIIFKEVGSYSVVMKPPFILPDVPIIQFDNKTKEAFVEIEISDQNFEKRQIEVGISDGVFAEVLSGVTINDKIKVWNKTEPIKRGDVEDVDDEYKLDR